ncbi:hypothetical protein GALMADRAFT_341993 [Galerina marginata CBS 339.88]|uniref:Uncharacterized protein n=1 Tax=Galerina marginata (strain CBS 339.88) TaxID=685588 RepID=A0A067TPV1_GALM3|nr:hypothetical protein GALMADRAFT_341993 [Galerina marginata CBS 339.88]
MSSSCAALPPVNSAGTSVTCTTEADLRQRKAAICAGSVPIIKRRNPNRGRGGDGGDDGGDDNGDDSGDDNGADNGNGDGGDGSGSDVGDSSGGKGRGKPGKGGNNGNNGGDAQSSLTLDPDVIATGFANDGQDVPAAGQVASLTSINNFINFCKTVDLPLTNGTQVIGGSCNPAPMGSIPAKTSMPSSKFVFPKNGGKVAANKTFTVKMAISNLETGHFVNAQENYFSAPQQLNAQGIIQGHSHVIIEELGSLDQTTTTDPTVFAFFKGLNDAAQAGILSAVVDKGLPAGFYKLSSINSAANHQPVLAPVAQHGSLDDVVYFTVS